MKNFYDKFNKIFEEVCSSVSQNNSYDIIGTESSIWKLLVNEKGVITIETQYTPPEMETEIEYYKCVRRTLLTMFDPFEICLGTFIEAKSHTKLDGYLPISVITFASTKGIIKEYALVDKNDCLLVKIELNNECFYFKSAIPQNTDPAIIWQLENPKPEQLKDSREFDAALEEIKTYWNNKLSSVIQWECPSKYIKHGVLAAFVNAFLTQYNGAIRYGATRYYQDADRTAESFPPTIFTIFEACRYFGLQSEGERFFAHFLKNFVSSEGEILHRGNGASLSEHGMLLECAANASKEFQLKYKEIFDAVADRLFKLISKGELIDCCPEDDLRDYPYHKWFSCNLWVIRGLLEYNNFTTLSSEQKQSIVDFAEKVNEICNKETVFADNLRFVPPYPGYTEPFTDMNDFVDFVEGTNIHSICSYTNYRFYPEMLSSRILSNSLVRDIITFRKAKGGDFYGSTAFRIFKDYEPYRYCLDDWPIYHYLRGLAAYNEEDEFVRILVGHMAIHQSRGTYFAPEMSFKDYLDSTHCIPSQLILPLAISYINL